MAAPRSRTEQGRTTDDGSETWATWPDTTTRGGGRFCGADEFRLLMSHWPTGVTVITSWDVNNPVGCTLNAMMSVSLLPPLLLVALAVGSTTLGAIRRTGEFGLNVLSADQLHLCQRFARGSQHDRFDRLPYRRELQLPLLDDVAAAILCTVTDMFACGDHVLIVGTPVWFTAREYSSPLLFHRRTYHQLARMPVDPASAR